METINFNMRVDEPDITLSPAQRAAYDDVVAHISRHKSSGPVDAKTLCSKSPQNINSVDIRAIVSYARIKDKLPIGSCGAGYFWAESKKDYDITKAHFLSRVLKMLYALKMLEKHFIKEPDQLELFED